MLVLKDGRVIHLTPEQSQQMALVILCTDDMRKRIKAGGEEFSLADIVTDREEINRVLQQDIFPKSD